MLNKYLFLTIATGASANSEIMNLLKEVATYTKENNLVIKEAIIGIDGIKKALLNFVNFFSKGNVVSFNTKEEALDYLVE